MRKNLWKLAGLGGVALMLSSPADAEITCTQTPDCASLGYTKTAAQCPSGGVRCPFNTNLMFCLKNTTAYNFQLTVPTTQYNVVYHDGTNSPAYTYNANKTPIGVVYYVYPKSGGTHGLIMSKEQPILGTYAEAVEYCKNYVVKGTNVGDWRLPDVVELMYMGLIQSQGANTDYYTNLNSKLYTIRRAEILGRSASPNYTGYTSSPDYASSSDFYINQYVYWSVNDSYSSPASTAYTVNLNTYNYVNHYSKTSKYHFRCVMDF